MKLPLFVVVVVLGAAWACRADVGPSILVVQAHADDDTSFSGLLYATVRNLGGTVDFVVVSDGAGGYSCSIISEWTYKLRLTEPRIGRDNLPRIRMGEMLAGAEVVGAREVFFLYEPDVAYTTNVTVLDSWWDVDLVQYQLVKILTRRHYDYLVVMLPTADTHGEHAAASLLALQAVASLPPGQPRPVCLGGTNPGPWDGSLPGFPITSAPAMPAFSFNRLAPIGDPQRGLDYTVIANTVISKHVSQGCLQATLDDPPQTVEYYWYFDINAPSAFNRTAHFFAALNKLPFVEFVACL